MGGTPVKRWWIVLGGVVGLVVVLLLAVTLLIDAESVRGPIETFARHPMEWRIVMQDVRIVGQSILRRRHHQVPFFAARPGSAHVDESHRLVGLLADVSSDGLVLAASRDDEIRPWCLELARLILDDAP